MKDAIVSSIGKMLWALAFSAIPAISIRDVPDDIRDCLIFGAIMFSCHLILMKINEVLDAIKNKDSDL